MIQVLIQKEKAVRNSQINQKMIRNSNWNTDMFINNKGILYIRRWLIVYLIKIRIEIQKCFWRGYKRRKQSIILKVILIF